MIKKKIWSLILIFLLISNPFYSHSLGLEENKEEMGNSLNMQKIYRLLVSDYIICNQNEDTGEFFQINCLIKLKKSNNITFNFKGTMLGRMKFLGYYSSSKVLDLRVDKNSLFLSFPPSEQMVFLSLFLKSTFTPSFKIKEVEELYLISKEEMEKLLKTYNYYKEVKKLKELLGDFYVSYSIENVSASLEEIDEYLKDLSEDDIISLIKGEPLFIYVNGSKCLAKLEDDKIIVNGPCGYGDAILNYKLKPKKKLEEIKISDLPYIDYFQTIIAEEKESLENMSAIILSPASLVSVFSDFFKSKENVIVVSEDTWKEIERTLTEFFQNSFQSFPLQESFIMLGIDENGKVEVLARNLGWQSFVRGEFPEVDESTKLLVSVHFHPNGVLKFSKEDLISLFEVSKEYGPKVNVIEGVCAIEDNSIKIKLYELSPDQNFFKKIDDKLRKVNEKNKDKLNEIAKEIEKRIKEVKFFSSPVSFVKKINLDNLIYLLFNPKIKLEEEKIFHTIREEFESSLSNLEHLMKVLSSINSEESKELLRKIEKLYEKIDRIESLVRNYLTLKEFEENLEEEVKYLENIIKDNRLVDEIIGSFTGEAEVIGKGYSGDIKSLFNRIFSLFLCVEKGGAIEAGIRELKICENSETVKLNFNKGNIKEAFSSVNFISEEEGKNLFSSFGLDFKKWLEKNKHKIEEIIDLEFREPYSSKLTSYEKIDSFINSIREEIVGDEELKGIIEKALKDLEEQIYYSLLSLKGFPLQKPPSYIPQNLGGITIYRNEKGEIVLIERGGESEHILDVFFREEKISQPKKMAKTITFSSEGKSISKISVNGKTIIVDWKRDKYLKEIYENVKKEVLSLKPKNDEEAIRFFFETIKKHLPPLDTNFWVKTSKDEFLIGDVLIHGGFPKYYGILSTAILNRFKDENVISRNVKIAFIERNIHGWCEVELSQGKKIVVDIGLNYVGSPEEGEYLYLAESTREKKENLLDVFRKHTPGVKLEWVLEREEVEKIMEDDPKQLIGKKVALKR
ncbi:MAG: hypothetical protein QXD89_02475, partial [Candidatus Aenigmatarchaeota archaeon]